MKPKLLSKKEVDRIIARNNAKFRKATKAQQRVLIAKDVIARVESGQFAPRRSIWFRNSDKLKGALQTEFVSGKQCLGCALGGLMMSCTVFNNKESAEELMSARWNDTGVEISNSRDFPNGLTDIFSPDQLAMIETAFEGSCHVWVGQSHEEIGKAKSFNNHWDTQTQLLSIMRNIVRNKGTFVP